MRYPDNVKGIRAKHRHDLQIANSYLQGDIEFGEANYRLKNRNSHSNLILGEIALEEAKLAIDRDFSIASTQFNYAKQCFQKAANPPRYESLASKESSQIKAHLRLTQFPALPKVLIDRKLPERGVVRGMYERMIGLGNDTLKFIPDIFNRNDNSAIELKGILGEMAVMSLAQRYSLRDGSSQVWLPIQSMFSEDHGGNCIAETDEESWDMSIFTQYDLDDPVKLPYKIQIKTAARRYEQDNGVTYVNICPDLKLHNKEDPRSVIGSILVGCSLEIKRPNKCERITDLLDQRTEMLLDKID